MATQITTVKKARAGEQDLNWDTAGTSSTASVPNSTGGVRTIDRINASHVPTTNTTRALKTAGNVALTETNVDDSLQQLFADNLLQGIPDDSTIATTSGVMAVKTGGITATQLASNSVDSAEIVAGSVDNDKLNPTSTSAAVAGSAATGGKVDVIQAASIGVANMAANSIDSDQYVDGSIDNVHIADGVIKAVKMLDAPSHYIIAEDITSSTTGTTTLLFTTSATVNAADMLFVNVTAFGTSVSSYVGTCLRTGANQVSIEVDANQTGGSTTAELMILKAVTA